MKIIYKDTYWEYSREELEYMLLDVELHSNNEYLGLVLKNTYLVDIGFSICDFLKNRSLSHVS